MDSHITKLPDPSHRHRLTECEPCDLALPNPIPTGSGGDPYHYFPGWPHSRAASAWSGRGRSPEVSKGPLEALARSQIRGAIFVDGGASHDPVRPTLEPAKPCVTIRGDECEGDPHENRNATVGGPGYVPLPRQGGSPHASFRACPLYECCRTGLWGWTLTVRRRSHAKSRQAVQHD